MEFDEVLKHYEKSKKTRRVIDLNDNNKNDVDLSKLNVGINIKSCFCKSEVSGVVGLDNLLQSTVEIKNHYSAIPFNSLFIEYKTFFKERDSNEDSGILTSKADMWLFQLDEISLFYPIEFLKWMYNNRNTLNLQDGYSNDESHVATGLIVPFGLIIPLYEQYVRQKRLKELKTQ